MSGVGKVALPALLGLLLTVGCESPSPMPPPTPPPMGTLQLGTVDYAKYQDARWVDLSDGSAMQLEPGVQGGFHLWLLYRVQGVTGPVRVRRIADRLPPDGSMPQRVLTTESVLTIPAGESWQLPDPIPNFMCPVPIGLNVLDAPIQLSVELLQPEVSTPEKPALAATKLTVRPMCPPVGDPQREFCLRICQG